MNENIFLLFMFFYYHALCKDPQPSKFLSRKARTSQKKRNRSPSIDGLAGLVTPINVSFEVPKKVAVILVHKVAAKLPALKHFLHSKKAFCVVDFPILMQQRL